MTYETPEPVVTDLIIDKGKAWSFISDDVTKAQADYAFTEDWTRDASEQMKITIDTGILGDIYSDAHSKNQGATAGFRSSSYDFGVSGSPVALDKTNILDYIVDMGSALDEHSVPEGERFVVLPPWACGMIKKSDLKDASLAGDGTSIMRNGRLGIIDRFTLYASNLLATTTDGANSVTNMIFGQKTALTFASQLIENEGPMRDKDFFGDFYRGLQVYGYKVIKPEAIGWFYAYKA